MRLNLPLFNPMNHIGHCRIHGDRYADLPPQLHHITVDEVDFRPQARSKSCNIEALISPYVAMIWSIQTLYSSPGTLVPCQPGGFGSTIIRSAATRLPAQPTLLANRLF